MNGVLSLIMELEVEEMLSSAPAIAVSQSPSLLEDKQQGFHLEADGSP